ncbi:hypothetical protein B0T26DRAFT_616004, partial [Lasiosphaeria miniovina]
PSPYPDQKVQRVSPAHSTKNAVGELTIGTLSSPPKPTDPVDFWASEGRWPDQKLWPEETLQTPLTIENLVGRKRSPLNLSREPSITMTTSLTPSDQMSRDEKTTGYRDRHYETLLETKGSYMSECPDGLDAASQYVCRSLLEKTQPVPVDSLFRNDLFEATCRKLQNKNEARIIQDISRLIVPSAESLATRRVRNHLSILVESVNEGWSNSIPLTNHRLQPDYSVGFGRGAFTSSQLGKLSPLVGEYYDQSFFMATCYMFFPFLACEVTRGGGDNAERLDSADRQNAHSMTLAVRSVVELFRAVHRESEIHRQVLAFSISHNHRSVRIFGHYPVIIGKDTRYYRHPICAYDFMGSNAKDKWIAYRFTRNVYDVWIPVHFKNVCSAIDQLHSGLTFDVSSL